MLLREAADHEQAHPAGGVDGDLAAALERVVGLGQRVAGHAEAVVDDLDLDLAVLLAGLDRDRAAGGRVGQGVVDELRHQVDDVGRGAPHDHPVGGGVDAHALVVLDLGDRGVDHVRDAELLEPGGPTRSTTEDHQGLGRPAHAGGQVVEAEQLLEALRVFLVLLQRLDQRELLVDQRGVAARQGHEHGADLRPQLGLAGRQGDRLLVHVVHGPGELAQLLVAVHGDRDDLVGLLAVPDPGHRLGQLLVGHVEGARAHLAQGHDQGTGDEERQQQRGEQREQDDRGVGQRARTSSRTRSRRACPGCRRAALCSGRRRCWNSLGVATRSLVLLLVAWPRRVPLAVVQDVERRPPTYGPEVVEGRALDADLRGEPHRVEQRRLLGRSSG